MEIHPLSSWGIPYQGLFVVAGPCSVESEEQMLRTALALSGRGVSLLRGGVWKPRTSPGSFEGVGAVGLGWLKQAGAAAGLPVATEVATPEHVEQALRNGIDVLWIGARTSVNPFALQALADCLAGSDVPVMLKNPVCPDLALWIGGFERLANRGMTKLTAVHRGFSTASPTKYRNEPNWSIPLELRRRLPGMPLLCDPSHICGDKELIFGATQEAVDLLYDGLMVEVHTAPEEALSDASQQLTPAEFHALASRLRPKQPTSDNREYKEGIRPLRKEIDEIDDQIIRKIAQRMDVVRRIARFKRENDVSTYQPDRWKEIIQNRIESGRERALSPDFVLQLYVSIHQEAIRIQEEETLGLPQGGDGAAGTGSS